MKLFTIATILALAASSAAGQIGHGGYGYGHTNGQGHHSSHDYYAYPKYTYNYGVADKLTGDQKSAGETRDGEIVKGFYQLVQPDGVLRTVHYWSSPKEGFQAQVINKGKALHPALYGKGHGGHGYYGFGLGSGLGREVGGYSEGIRTGGVSGAGRGIGGFGGGLGSRGNYGAGVPSVLG